MLIHGRTQRGSGLVNSLIDKLPWELHLPGYHFCGPGTKLQQRLKKSQKGINKLDSACRLHDIAYSQTKNLQDRHLADADLISAANQRLFAKDSSIGERLAAATVSSLVGVKKKLGMGLKRKKKTKKRGGFITPLLTGIGAASGLIGGASNLYKNYRSLQHNAKMLGEIQKHNAAIQSIVSGKGMYLRPFKTYKGRGHRRRRKKKKH